MSQVTLILTRTPLEEFRLGKKSGRWGRMAVVRGPEVTAAKFREATPKPRHAAPPLAPMAEALQPVARGIAAAVLQTIDASGFRSRQAPVQVMSFADRELELKTVDGRVEELAEFDTMERFRADSGSGFYMQVRPRSEPYPLTMFKSTTVADLNGTGECLRVHDHGYRQQGSGGTAGILIHEAPNVGYVIGCIAPREKNNRQQGDKHWKPSPSKKAMDDIFKAMGGFKAGTKASLFVLDW
jgi:hypothetical protein